ncbi:hypothetical protein [Mesoflavibacter sp. SCSIO 43206]|uniref:hypothetical protein n=1 Tax=Mesoflavibacter sp. SCSIO 43206 TaxID=2779362 RepID=UPI001CA933C8|nr:hypothetical protein [Mesoflavibacter sp. SCSIO 43206]UAB75609.1 hypothetical protein INR78_01070 [Mesoflavibacter sp. SCSIO 43206]
MKLKQRRLFTQKELTLNKNSIKVKVKNLTSSEETTISLEEIDTRKMVYQKKTDTLMLIVTLFFGIFFLINIFNPENYKPDQDDPYGVFIFLFLASLFSGLITFLKSKNVILIPTMNNGYLEVFRSKPSENDVDDFISKLSEKINKSLKDKYGKLDLGMPTEQQLMNISWLKEREVISELEFEQLKTQLTSLRKDQNKIGFKD